MEEAKQGRFDPTDYQRNRRQRAIAAGKCSICCSHPARPDHKTCEICGVRWRKYARGPRAHKARTFVGKTCLVCGREAKPARRGLCGTCYGRGMYQLKRDLASGTPASTEASLAAVG